MDPKGEELAAVIAEIRQRVRTRKPNGAGPAEIALPDLMPLLHARDAAEGKVASIGTVNPRPPGLVNSLIQAWKRMVARALDWHVREQVEFNRALIACVQSTIEALNECNQAIRQWSHLMQEMIQQAVEQAAREATKERDQVLAALAALGERLERVSEDTTELRQDAAGLREEARELKDIRTHWIEWRAGWEQKLAASEIHLLRSVSELQAAFQHRVTLMDASYREQVKAQHAEFKADLARQSEAVQKRFWEELDRVRGEYERMIHTELRLLRQRASLAELVERAVESAPQASAQIDWLKFADRFRGTEEDIRGRQRMYARRFQGHEPVLDIGCGRGEMLEVFREAGIHARGIDLNDDAIAVCLSHGLEAEKADLFAYLKDLPEASLGGVVCCQVVEHLPPERLPEMLRLLHRALRAGGRVAIETPNPECLAIFATHFYLDPTHRHPIPPALAGFYLEEAGFGRIEIERLAPAIESIPSLAELPEGFRQVFFGSLDYAAFAIKLG